MKPDTPGANVPPAFDRVLTTHDAKPKIELLQSGPFLSQYSITYKWDIPANLAEGKGDYVRRLDAEGDDATRSEETREIVIKSVLTLHKESQGLEIKTTILNSSKDHRLRAMFPTHISATHSCAEEPFDVIERPIDRGREAPGITHGIQLTRISDLSMSVMVKLDLPLSMMVYGSMR